ncbi:MAG: TonB-dependent receptor [Ferruginibacter sp.]
MVRKLNKSFCTLLLLMVCSTPVIYAQNPATAPNDSLALKKADSLFNDVKDNVQDNIPTVSLDENDLGDGGGSGQSVSSVLAAGRDPYYNAASFNFSEMRFRIRGYDNDYFSTFMNGIPMDNLDNGATPFGLWGGLNDVMRNRDVSYGLRPNPFTFGDIGSNTNIDSRASIQRKQTSFGYAFSNRNYGHRWMLTHSTGMSKSGWAFSFSGSRRWSGEGYVPGTYYDGWSYFAAIDKKLNNDNLLSLTVFGAPTENGRQGAAVQEMMDLAGSNYYNPLWGYQNGKKRNSSIGKTNQPVVILTHDARLSDKSKLTTAVGYSWGDRSVTALDWYNTADPRPDYYRYLPSYYMQYYNGQGGFVDSARYNYLKDVMSKDETLRQVNWDKLYEVNQGQYDVVQNANGIPGNTVAGRRSRYIVENRIVNTKRFNANSVYNTLLGKNIDLSVGAFLQVQENHYYKKVEDLLGGDFYVNVNQFAERDFSGDDIKNQNDISRPNRILHVGDKFGYDYMMIFDKVGGWAQSVFKFNKVDLFAAGQWSHTRFWRIGFNRNGLYPDESGGGADRVILNNYSVKAGATYKINGRNYLFANGTYQTKPPFFENVYQSARTRNTLVDNITSEKIKSVEAGYIMNAPKIKIRINGYYTRFEDGMDVITYYDDFYNSFGNISITNIDKVHFGGEFGIEGNLGRGLTANAAAAIGRYYYDSRQQYTLTVDNTAEVINKDVTVYSQNYRVPSTPQEAYSLGLTYRSPKFWFVSLTGNYYRQAWLSFSPIRRTAVAVDGLEEGSKLRNDILAQQKFDDQFMLNFFGGWSYKLPKSFNIKGRSTFLVFNLGVNNILNNKDAVTGGFEQLRFDDENRNVDKFPPKYFYAWGLNYFASATIRF